MVSDYVVVYFFLLCFCNFVFMHATDKANLLKGMNNTEQEDVGTTFDRLMLMVDDDTNFSQESLNNSNEEDANKWARDHLMHLNDFSKLFFIYGVEKRTCTSSACGAEGFSAFKMNHLNITVEAGCDIEVLMCDKFEYSSSNIMDKNCNAAGCQSKTAMAEAKHINQLPPVFFVSLNRARSFNDFDENATANKRSRLDNDTEGVNESSTKRAKTSSDTPGRCSGIQHIIFPDSMLQNV